MDSLPNGPKDILEFDQDDALVEVPPNDAAAAVPCDMLLFDGNVDPVLSSTAVDSLEFDKGSEPPEVLPNNPAVGAQCDSLEFCESSEPAEVLPTSTPDATPCDLLEFDQGSEPVEVPPSSIAIAAPSDSLESDQDIEPVKILQSSVAIAAPSDSLEFGQGSEPVEVLPTSTPDATPCDLLEFDQDTEPAEVQPKTTTIELNGEEFWPLSGKPYFHTFITEAVFKRYQLVVPSKVHQILPSLNIPLTLTYCGKRWKMLYSGKSNCKRINYGFKEFSIDNNLKVGDACVFELVEGTSEQVTFRVQILRGDIPSQFQSEMNGEQADAPIFID